MPNPHQFATHADYLRWYADYRQAHRQSIRERHRAYQRKRREKRRAALAGWEGHDL